MKIVRGCSVRGRKENNDYFGKVEKRRDGKANALLLSEQNSMVYMDKRIRKFTPLECERLQTVDDNYTNHVSDTQRYKMLGNGWTVDVISHIFSYLKK